MMFPLFLLYKDTEDFCVAHFNIKCVIYFEFLQSLNYEILGVEH